MKKGECFNLNHTLGCLPYSIPDYSTSRSSLSFQLADLLSLLIPSKHYIQYYYEKKNLNYVSCFCVLGSSVLHVDTTFEINDNLRVTDTSFINDFLIDENKNPLKFRGPNIVYFHKDPQA